MLLGRDTEFLRIYAAASHHLPTRAEGWLGQAEILQRRGETEAAKDVLRQSLSSVTDRVDVVRQYIVLSMIEGQAIKDVTADVLADVVDIGGEISETAAFTIEKLRGRIDGETRGRSSRAI